MTEKFNHSMPIEQWAEEMQIPELVIKQIAASVEALCPNLYKYIEDNIDENDDDYSALERHIKIFLRQWYMEMTEE